jgi:beta-lactamase regulating signal transducer with metallopeptidase domain
MPDHTVPLLVLLLDWIAKGFVILGLVFLADLPLRRANASLRHLIWLVGLAAVMLLPIISRMLPSLDVPLLHLDFLAANPAQETASVGGGSEAGLGWSTSEILLAAYAAGALLVLAWQLIGRAYAYRLRRRAGRITQAEINRELLRLKAALGIRNPVDLLSSDLISIPFSTGYLHPVIILPKATSAWPAPVVESVLIHELAHIKRRDILARIAAQISCCIHWINPLAWYGLGRIMMEQEIACDNLVLDTGTKASDYARNLLALAEVRRGSMDFALTAFGRRTELKSRLLEILKPTRKRTPMRIGGVLVFLALMVGLLMPVSALNIWDASDAGTLVKPPGVIPQEISAPRATANAQAPQPLVMPIPDIEKAKKQFEKKLQDLKESGASQEEIAKFTKEAKAKIGLLQRQQLKQSEEKTKQLEMMMLNEGKKAK